MPRANFTRNRALSQTTASGSSEKPPRIDELVDMLKLKEGKWYQIRLIGPAFSYGSHWIDVKGKLKDATFTKQCLAYNDATESLDSTIECPYCDMLGDRPAVHYYQNIIVRQDEDDNPGEKNRLSKKEKTTGFKDDKESDAWTPVKVLRLPPAAIASLRQLSELNKHGEKGKKVAYDITDDEFGCDLQYMFDNSKQGSAKHSFQKDAHSPLQEIELEYLLWNIEDIIKPEEFDVAVKECESISTRLITKDKNQSSKEVAYKDPKASRGRRNQDEDTYSEEEDTSPRNSKRFSDEDEVDTKESRRRFVDSNDEEESKPSSKKNKKDLDIDEEEAAPKTSGKRKYPGDDEPDEETSKPSKPNKKTNGFDDDEEDTASVRAEGTTKKKNNKPLFDEDDPSEKEDD